MRNTLPQCWPFGCVYRPRQQRLCAYDILITPRLDRWKKYRNVKRKQCSNLCIYCGKRNYSLPDLLKEAAIECPDRNACISWTVNGERSFITFSELYTKSELFVKGLSTLGYVKDSIIAIETRNTPDWFFIINFLSYLLLVSLINNKFETRNYICKCQLVYNVRLSRFWCSPFPL
jgi:hypothetical protein